MAEEKKGALQQDVKLSGWISFFAVLAVLAALIFTIGLLVHIHSAKPTPATQSTSIPPTPDQKKLTDDVKKFITQGQQAVTTYQWSAFEHAEFSPLPGYTYYIVFDKPGEMVRVNFEAFGPMRYSITSAEHGFTTLTSDGRVIPVPAGDAGRAIWLGPSYHLKVQSEAPQTIVIQTGRV